MAEGSDDEVASAGRRRRVAERTISARTIEVDAAVASAIAFVAGVAVADCYGFRSGVTTDYDASSGRLDSWLLCAPWPIALATATFVWAAVASCVGTKSVVVEQACCLAVGSAIKAISAGAGSFSGLVIGQCACALSLSASPPVVATAAASGMTIEGILAPRIPVATIGVPALAFALGIGVVAPWSPIAASTRAALAATCSGEAVIASGIAFVATRAFNGTKRRGRDGLCGFAGRTRVRTATASSSGAIDGVGESTVPGRPGSRRFRCSICTWIAGVIVDVTRTAFGWKRMACLLGLSTAAWTATAVRTAGDAWMTSRGSTRFDLMYAFGAIGATLATSTLWLASRSRRWKRPAAVVGFIVSAIGCAACVGSIADAPREEPNRIGRELVVACSAGFVGWGTIATVTSAFDGFLEHSRPVDPGLAASVVGFILVAPILGAIACVSENPPTVSLSIALGACVCSAIALAFVDRKQQEEVQTPVEERV